MIEEEMMFDLEGAEPAPKAVEDVRDVRKASRRAWFEDLSDTAREVYAAAQRVQSALQPGQVADLHAFGQRLANELPNARVVLRRGAPKRAPSPVEDSTFGLRNLRHTFLVVQTGASDEELIIEPTFRPHFTVPGSGPAFDAALLEAPELLVAAVRQLIPLVHEMAQAISHETTRQGRAVAPWRSAGALLSMWLPSHFLDTPFTAQPATAAAAAAAAVPSTPATQAPPTLTGFTVPPSAAAAAAAAARGVASDAAGHVPVAAAAHKVVAVVPRKVVQGFSIGTVADNVIVPETPAAPVPAAVVAAAPVVAAKVPAAAAAAAVEPVVDKVASEAPAAVAIPAATTPADTAVKVVSADTVPAPHAVLPAVAALQAPRSQSAAGAATPSKAAAAGRLQAAPAAMAHTALASLVSLPAKAAAHAAPVSVKELLLSPRIRAANGTGVNAGHGEHHSPSLRYWRVRRTTTAGLHSGCGTPVADWLPCGSLPRVVAG